MTAPLSLSAISDEAVEAAVEAHCEGTMRAALEAAAPFIRAAALEAAAVSIDNGGKISAWLRARAAAERGGE